MSSLLNLPVDVLLPIVEYLPLDDLKSFSSCSRACRKVSSRTLFRGIKLSSYESICAFESGSLAPHRQHVCHVNLAPVLDDKDVKPMPNSKGGPEVPSDVAKFMNLLTICQMMLKSLEGFTRITKLTITGNFLQRHQGTLVLAMLNRVFRMPFYRTLKHFGLRTGRMSPGYGFILENDLFFLQQNHRQYLSAADWDFIWTPNRTYSRRDLGTDCPQPALESAIIFCKHLIFTEKSLPTFSLTTGAFFFVFSSAATLKKLHLHVGDSVTFGLPSWEAQHMGEPEKVAPYWTFPRVKELWMDVESAVDDVWLKQIIVRFPNMEDFRLDACFYSNGTQRVGYHIPDSSLATYRNPWFFELQALKGLRKVTLPWPKQHRGEFLEERHLTGTPAPLLYNGLEYLEEIVFRLRPSATQSRPDEKPRNLIGIRKKVQGEDSEFRWKTYILPEPWSISDDSGWYSHNDKVAFGYHTRCKCQPPSRYRRSLSLAIQL
ncbi:hypothetical protein TWF281_002919 [Arthrobotrys megalospora]